MHPYIYELYHLPTGKRYIGSQYGKMSNPKNIWNTYFTSSDTVKSMLDTGSVSDWRVTVYDKKGADPNDVIAEEMEFILAMKEAIGPFLLINKGIYTKNGITSFYKMQHTDDWKRSASERNRKRWNDPAYREKMKRQKTCIFTKMSVSLTCKRHWKSSLKGCQKSEATKQRMRESAKNRDYSHTRNPKKLETYSLRHIATKRIETDISLNLRKKCDLDAQSLYHLQAGRVMSSHGWEILIDGVWSLSKESLAVSTQQ